MAIQRPTLLCLLGLFAFLHFQLAATTIDVTAFTESNTIERDICIIGGGSSGTYAAVRLLQSGKSVALIEKQDRLGGHVNTYIDPATGVSFDYGVLFLDNITVVVDYASFLNVSLAVLSQQQGPIDYANFATGDLVPATIFPSITAQVEAFLTYSKILDQYPFLSNGFDLPDPVPADLLLPFGEFLQIYNLSTIAIDILFVAEVGNILAQPTLYIMKVFPQITVDTFSSENSLSTANQDNQELYNAALAYIGNRTNVFLGSKVVQIERSECSVKVVVSTPYGEKLIKASKLLIAIQPKLENLESIGLDLDRQEKYLFGQFNNDYLWNMVISNAIPSSNRILNIQPGALGLVPSLPGLYFIYPTRVPDLYVAAYGSPYYLSNDQVKADVLATLARINAANGVPTNSTPKIVAFQNHSPWTLKVSVEAIKSGFYSDVNALQGQGNTWWTGATFQAQDSSLIWNWTEYNLLPRILASL